ncbi:CoA transferase [Nocardia spumae]|uniref:CoA transferase n=1 Tax=Nocardia spumae TaxID=2887190 RepID=UPI001D139B02|nr:CoA transferase [Nocardia spumae]
MTTTPLSGPPIELIPPGTIATVTGSGATARVLREHLGALGAATSDGPEEESAAAATAVLEFLDGTRRELVIDWSGPVRDSALTDETAVQAICGVMQVNGRRTGAPRGLELDYCATVAGVLGMTGLLASLLLPRRRLRVQTSVAETALLGISQYLAAAGADDPEAVAPVPGGPPFVSADGIRFEIESLLPEPWAAFWSALDADRNALRKGWRPFQFRYATAAAPMPEDLHRTTRSHTFAAISDAAARTGVSVCRLYAPSDPATPDPRLLAAPWSIADLAERRSVHRVSASGSATAPLAGLRVLEAGRRVQAPLAAHLLRLLGAEVTRIEPPGGDPLRDMPPCSGDISARWLALNRHKRALEFDIKSAADQDRLRELTAEYDVFLHNWAPGKAEQFGLRGRDLPPGTVYLHTSGWSGADLTDLPPGTDFMVQARTGLAELVGPPDTPPAPTLMTVLDVLGGILGAQAAVIALLRRRATGIGVSAESSLLSASNTLRQHASGATATRPRQPFRLDGAWVVAGASGVPVRVTTDLAELVGDPRFADVLGRDDHGCPALTTPWRMS